MHGTFQNCGDLEEFCASDFNRFMQSDPQSVNASFGASGNYIRFSSKDSGIPVNFESLRNEDELELTITDIKNGRGILLNNVAPLNKVSLTFISRGSMEAHLQGAHNNWKGFEGEAALSSPHGIRSRNILFHPHDERCVIIQISMPAERFMAFIGDVTQHITEENIENINSATAAVIDQRKLSAQIVLAIEQVFSTNVSTSARPYYLLSKTWELLTLYADGLNVNEKKHRPIKRIQPAVADRLERAKQIVLADLAENHTIASLSEAVYLSESTLTHGFRSYFNTSVHNFIVTSRLESARQLIAESPSRNVSDVAYQVGFKCPSRFASIFSKTFGVLPSAYRDSLRTRNN
ncbi:MAG: helix-turn-helix transcriptional regulator [Pseudomonadota bacterium]